MTEAQIYAEAGRIIHIAMGNEMAGNPRRRHKVWRAEEDPLAFWCGVEAIVSLVSCAALQQQGEGK